MLTFSLRPTTCLETTVLSGCQIAEENIEKRAGNSQG